MPQSSDAALATSEHQPATPKGEADPRPKGSRRSLERTLAYQATHDKLTGLANRAAFEARLATMINDARSSKPSTHVLAYIDLDQFKLVNDTCGHSAGDQLLQRVAELFARHVSADDMLARIGGDEFAFLLYERSIEQATALAEAVLKELRRFRFCWNGVAFDVGASIGLTAINARSGAADDVLGQADIACYAAKDGGRDRVEIYGSGLTSQRHREMRWPSRLNRALEAGRLNLASQPIVSLDGDDGVHRFEMLMRLRGENGEWIFPGEFIPAAERFNLMPALDRWVASWVLREMLFDEPDACSYVLAINVSGVSLNDDRFLDWLLNEIRAAGPVASSLSIEVTETAAVRNLDNAATFIRGARRLGCHVALDDFGSGLSSFAYLDKLEVDMIKIDGHFVRSMTRGGVGRHVVAAVAQLGRAMGVKLVAEQVEDAATAASLQPLGVQFAQGYYFARPTLVPPYAKLSDLARAQHRPIVAPPAATTLLAG